MKLKLNLANVLVYSCNLLTQMIFLSLAALVVWPKYHHLLRVRVHHRHSSNSLSIEHWGKSHKFRDCFLRDGKKLLSERWLPTHTFVLSLLLIAADHALDTGHQTRL